MKVLIGILFSFLAWEFGSRFVDRLFLPSPVDVAVNFIVLAQMSNFYIDILATLKRTLIGLFFGISFGIIAGTTFGCSRRISQVAQFPVDFLRSIPATALFPLLIVIFGLGEEVKIFVAAWATSFIILINTLYGIQSVSLIRLSVAKLKKFSLLKKAKLIFIPSAAPHIVAGIRVSLSLALIVELVAEMFLGSSRGLGHRLFNAASIFQMEEVYACILIIGCIGYGLNQLVIRLERRTIHWAGYA